MQTAIVESHLHGARAFARIGERPHTTKDGRQTKLALWASKCTLKGNARVLIGTCPPQHFYSRIAKLMTTTL
jgi:hypothetical protein